MGWAKLWAAAVTAAAIAAAPASAAEVLFDNGGASVPGSGGPGLTDWTPVDDFILARDARVSGGTFDAGAYPTDDFTGLRFYIYADSLYGSVHRPSSLLSSGSATVTATTYLGHPGYIPHTRATFTFDTPFVAEAGVRYWFGLHQTIADGVSWTVRDFSPSLVWENYRFDPPGTFRGNTYERPFSLTGTAIPEPMAWTVFIAGLGLAGVHLRLRRIGAHG